MKVLPERIPLTTEEADWLMTIYNKRFDSLFFGGLFRCFILCCIWFVVLDPVIGMFHDQLFPGTETWLSVKFLFSDWDVKILAFSAITLIICACTYYVKIRPYQSDVASGYKLTAEFIVTWKKYYELTGQYFIFVRGGDIRGIEVTEKTFNACEEGGVFHIGITRRSRHLILENDHIKTTMFEIRRPRGMWGF